MSEKYFLKCQCWGVAIRTDGLVNCNCHREECPKMDNRGHFEPGCLVKSE